MKQIFKPLILVLLTILPTTTLAHDFEVNGIYYNILNSNQAAVTYQGASFWYYNEYTGDVTIPSTVTHNGTTYSVISIGWSAFCDCTGLTSINIPNSVTSIGSQAFLYCSGLTSVTIPNSVTFIDDRAFTGCSGLTSITVENGTPKYDSRNNCNAIIETATHTLIAGCMNTIIPNSVTSIGYSAFDGCSGLTSITIPNSVTSIGGCAFWGCSGLTSLFVPISVTSIGQDAFAYCSGLSSITVASENPKYDSRNNCNAIIETATNTLIAGCMITTIPNFVTSIGNSAFQGCSGLTSVNIPNSVTSIGRSSFYGCTGLTSVNIPNSVTTIGDYAFDGCTGLTSINIPNSVTSIGDIAFSGCSGLINVTCLAIMPPTIYCYDTYGAFPSEVTNQATLYVPRESLIAYQTADNWKDFSRIVEFNFEVDGIWYSVLTDSTATVIQKSGEGDLYQGDVVIPDSVSYLDYTFSVSAIDEGAFEDCYELTSVVIGDAVETIGENSFQGCTGLTRVTIGSGVNSIGAKAFNYCNALQTVTCRGTLPPVMANTNCFSNAAYSRATLIVPRQQLEAYQGADYWYRFSNIEGWGSAGMGDVNADGKVSISDVTTLINIMLSGNGEYNADADLNYNGRMDIGDVATIIDYLLNE